jgi:hypothetical protein
LMLPDSFTSSLRLSFQFASPTLPFSVFSRW